MWTKIIEKMYEDQDAQVLQDNIRAIIQMRATGQNYQTASSARGPPKADATARKLTREELTKEVVSVTKISQQLLYSDFQKAILDYQLREHERFLKSFTQLFKSVDEDLDGVISEEEFRQLLTEMNLVDSDEEVQLLLHQVDPFNN